MKYCCETLGTVTHQKIVVQVDLQGVCCLFQPGVVMLLLAVVKLYFLNLPGQVHPLLKKNTQLRTSLTLLTIAVCMTLVVTFMVSRHLVSMGNMGSSSVFPRVLQIFLKFIMSSGPTSSKLRPSLVALAVRPLRWTYVSDVLGTLFFFSKEMRQ